MAAAASPRTAALRPIIPFIFPSIVFTFLETIVSNGFQINVYMSVAPSKWRSDCVSDYIVISDGTTNGTIDVYSAEARCDAGNIAFCPTLTLDFGLHVRG